MLFLHPHWYRVVDVSLQHCHNSGINYSELDNNGEKGIIPRQEVDYTNLDIDGVKVLFDDGWALVRASNTGPNLTLRFEATNETKCPLSSSFFTASSFSEDFNNLHGIEKVVEKW